MWTESRARGPTFVHVACQLRWGWMLGRRLLLLVAVLLATGAIAAALTPPELRDPSPSTTTRTTPPPSVTEGTGGTAAGATEVTRTVDARATKPIDVRAAQGDLLHLVVQ